ncbi:hypothetical protein N7520_003576 [Penicillium odoratum]|uniref:uncharacterized protein n=1 Tax=Penicillium odoratum TaxID=1167516 RepID=UPI0025480983|nr:uncharacterized protein N7520_003576 [Penicillium odoratum]KAJ5769017.1 hypothetical protein N7520_003576 [Penicillium odoratum]
MSNYQKEDHKQKTARRSRFGCRNCKLRKVKCDEHKPSCKRCNSFGVLCNFKSNIQDLQPIARPLPVQEKVEIEPVVSSAVWTCDDSTIYQLSAKCQDFISRYYGRSLTIPDDPNAIHVNRKLLNLAFAYPFLMHASLAVAYTYDRYLNGSPGCRRSIEECYHWSQSTTLLNKRLGEPIKENDKDPIWGTAAALAVLTFSSPDACTAEDSWPLISSATFDLDWLRMSRGKMALWHVVNPLRQESIFSIMAGTYADMHSPLPERGTDGILKPLTGICLLDDSSTAKNNPYFNAAHGLSHILNTPDSKITTGQTQLFTGSIHGEFEILLRKRDPVALLLLYLWYRKACRSIWWIELRARVECPSICAYLRLCHKGNVAVQAFLPDGALADRWNTII